MVRAPRESVTFRDAQIIFKNFKGEKKQYNPQGARNFSIMLDEPTALELERKGWNVKPLRRHEDDDEQRYHLKVKVNFGGKPPACWMVSSRGKTPLDEELVDMFDDLEFQKFDLIIQAYDWEVNGNKGRTAYLKSCFGTLDEDELHLEYADVPEISMGGVNSIESRVISPLPIESGARLPYDLDVEVVH